MDVPGVGGKNEIFSYMRFLGGNNADRVRRVIDD